MDKRKAVVVLVATLVVAVAISGWHIHIINNKCVNREYEQLELNLRFYSNTPLMVVDLNPPLLKYRGIRPSNFQAGSNVWTNDEWHRQMKVQIACWPGPDQGDCIRKLAGGDFTHKMMIDLGSGGALTEGEIEKILHNTTLTFHTHSTIPPIVRQIKMVKCHGCPGCDLKEYEDALVFDIGAYHNISFIIPEKRYGYEITVESQLKIGAVDGYFFDFEIFPFSEDLVEPPASSWYYCSGDDDLGEMYFVRVVPGNATYPPKIIAPEFVATTSHYEMIEGGLFEVKKRKYEVDVFFEPLGEEKDE